MTIKDFKVGQTVYILSAAFANEKNSVETATVVKVGWKYVTVKDGGGNEIRFSEYTAEASYVAPYLLEDRQYAIKRLLFPTAEAVDEYNELSDLQRWFRDAASWTKSNLYTLTQLQAVKMILDPEGERQA